jgi:hypothetical protein
LQPCWSGSLPQSVQRPGDPRLGDSTRSPVRPPIGGVLLEFRQEVLMDSAEMDVRRGRRCRASARSIGAGQLPNRRSASRAVRPIQELHRIAKSGARTRWGSLTSGRVGSRFRSPFRTTIPPTGSGVLSPLVPYLGRKSTLSIRVREGADGTDAAHAYSWLMYSGVCW